MKCYPDRAAHAHSQVADWLSRRPVSIFAYYNLIAHHAIQASQNERAATYLIWAERAGRATPIARRQPC
jgi:hypothetical protein